MADDVRVEESTLLREYSNRLQGFASSIEGGSRNMVDALERERDEFTSIIRKAEDLEHSMTNKVESLVRRYEDTRRQYNLDGINSAMLGITDQEVKQKLEHLRMRIESLKELSRRSQMQIDEMTERTKMFSQNVVGTSERGMESLNRQADVIDEYKNATS